MALLTVSLAYVELLLLVGYTEPTRMFPIDRLVASVWNITKYPLNTGVFLVSAWFLGFLTPFPNTVYLLAHTAFEFMMRTSETLPEFGQARAIGHEMSLKRSRDPPKSCVGVAALTNVQGERKIESPPEPADRGDPDRRSSAIPTHFSQKRLGQWRRKTWEENEL